MQSCCSWQQIELLTYCCSCPRSYTPAVQPNMFCCELSLRVGCVLHSRVRLPLDESILRNVVQCLNILGGVHLWMNASRSIFVFKIVCQQEAAAGSLTSVACQGGHHQQQQQQQPLRRLSWVRVCQVLKISESHPLLQQLLLDLQAPKYRCSLVA